MGEVKTEVDKAYETLTSLGVMFTISQQELIAKLQKQQKQKEAKDRVISMKIKAILEE